MTILFEYSEWAKVDDRRSLEDGLEKLWRQDLFVATESEEASSEQKIKHQPFLQFDGNRIRANNYVGFIQNGDEVIEIFPKVFRDIPNPHERKELMLRHIFYWFDYCRKWKFPFERATLDTLEFENFPELIINLIARQFLSAVSEKPLSMYQWVEETLQSPRGSS
jgi:5-methylcytosine-specific restriction enzyme subunit McrC